MSEPEYTRERFEKLVAGQKEWLMSITDQQLAEMQEHERAFVFRLRAGLRAFERGDTAELERMVQADLEAVREALSGDS